MIPDIINHQHGELQLHIHSLGDTIRDLRVSLAVETNPAIVNQLKHQISDKETERNRLAQQQDHLRAELLCFELLKLNRDRQVRAYRKVIQAHAASAFLIHGSRDHGQAWLLKRFVRLIPGVAIAEPFQYNFSVPSQRKDPNATWRAIHGWMCLDSLDAEPSRIIERICQRLVTQSVVLVFRNVDTITAYLFAQIMEQFWKPISQEVQSRVPPGAGTKLVLFCLDNSACVCNWNIPMVDASGPIPFGNSALVHLDQLTPFTDKELLNWIPAIRDILPDDVSDDLGTIVARILQDSDNGIPENVAETICRLCDCDYEGEDTWLRF